MFAPWSIGGGQRIHLISHSRTTEASVKSVSEDFEVAEEISEIESEVEDFNMVLDYHSKSESAQEINDIYRLSFIELHGGAFWMGCAFVLVIFLGILLKWLCSKPSMKHWRKGCCPGGEAPAMAAPTAVETQILELKEMMKRQQEVTVTPDASRLL